MKLDNFRCPYCGSITYEDTLTKEVRCYNCGFVCWIDEPKLEERTPAYVG